MKSYHSKLVVGLSCVFMTAGSVYAGTPSVLGNEAWALLSPKGTADLKTVSAGPSQALHVTIHKPSTPYYSTQLTHDINAAVPAGRPLHYHFWARSATSNPVHVVIEKRMAPYTRVMDKSLTLTPAWKEYTFTAPVPTAFGPRGMAARLQIGQKAGVIDVKQLAIN